MSISVYCTHLTFLLSSVPSPLRSRPPLLPSLLSPLRSSPHCGYGVWGAYKLPQRVRAELGSRMYLGAFQALINFHPLDCLMTNNVLCLCSRNDSRREFGIFARSVSAGISALELPLDCHTPLHYNRRPIYELSIWAGTSAGFWFGGQCPLAA